MKRSILWFVPLLIACGPFFYEAPQPLAAYPSRTPSKRWKELFRETDPPPPGSLAADELFAACRELPGRISSLEQKDALAAIDALLVRNREGDFRLNIANFLHEARELVSLKVPAAEAQPLLEWRLARIVEPAGLFAPKPQRQWDWDDAKWKEVNETHDREATAKVALIDEKIASASPVARPFWQTHRAFQLFQLQSFAKAAEELEKIIEDSPEHPRAEVAYLLLGRCSLEQARETRRKNGKESREESELRDAASIRFKNYREHYPKGRFLSDVAGWQAASAFDYHSFSGAIRYQLERLDIQPTRETKRSVMKECDLIFNAWTRSSDAEQPYQECFPYAAIASHPEVARLLVHYAIDPAADLSLPFPWDEGLDEGRMADIIRDRVHVPKWNQALVKLGRAMAANKAERQDPTSLLVLGWAALRSNEPGQALVLFDRGLVIRTTDELLQGRAQALTALGRHKEAAEAFLRLEGEFSQSPLAKGSIFERALARYRSGQAGQALADLWKLTPMHVTDEAFISLHDNSEIVQWVDAVEQFAPVPELASLLKSLPPEDPSIPDLRALIRSRALGAEDFKLAKLHLDPTVIQQPEEGSPAPTEEVEQPEYEGGPVRWNPKFRIRLNQARWDREVAPIEQATQRLATLPNSDPAKARQHLELARLWRDARGNLTLPVQALADFTQSEPEKLDQLRRQNAAILGIPAEEIVRELDSRDELNHALKHFLAAAEISRDPGVTAQALEGANEALFRLAEYSFYRATRAAETDATALSARLVARLKKEFPTRPEARRAVEWTFLPPTAISKWMPGDYVEWRCEHKLIQSFFYGSKVLASSRYDSYEPPSASDPEKDMAAELRKELDALANAPQAGMPEIQKHLASLQQKFQKARPDLTPDELNELSNDLDDLTLVAAVPGVIPDLFQRYARLRFAKAAPPAAEGEWKPLEPFLAYIDRIRPDANLNEFVDADSEDTQTDVWRNYLKNYPDSPKAEAASFRLLRQQVRSAGLGNGFRVGTIMFPEAPIPYGYKRIHPLRTKTPEEAQTLMASLDAHAKRFPAGRYRADLALLRAAVAMAQDKPEVALPELLSVAEDPQHPELAGAVAQYFAGCCAPLLEPERRAVYAAAFRAHPKAMQFLENLVEGDTCLSLLRPMMPWLERK